MVRSLPTIRWGEAITVLPELRSNSDNLTGLNGRQRLLDLGLQRTNVFDAVAGHNQDDDTDIDPSHVLLVLDASIDGYEHAEAGLCRLPEQVSVAQSGPSHLPNSPDLVPAADEISSEGPRH
jgi:hypothetical protein